MSKFNGGAYPCCKCSGRTEIVNSRGRNNYVYRRRVCVDCHERQTTREIDEASWQAMQRESADAKRMTDAVRHLFDLATEES